MVKCSNCPPSQRAKKLASLGFVWKAREVNKKHLQKPGKYDEKWMEMFNKLLRDTRRNMGTAMPPIIPKTRLLVPCGKEKANQGSGLVGSADAPMDVHFPETLIEVAIMDAMQSKPPRLSVLGKDEHEVYPDASMPEEELALYQDSMGELSATEETGSAFLAPKLQTDEEQMDTAQV